MSEKDFYIGYLPKMPKKTARAIKIFVLSAFAAALGLVGAAWTGQKPFAESFFEFGQVKDFEGVIEARAVPFLLLEKTEKIDNLPVFERIPLVAAGKHGFDAKAFDGRRVKLKGTLIYRNDLRMIEVVSAAIENSDIQPRQSIAKAESLGNFTLRGEIVDSKCYLGVMNPGRSKPHRDCAVACLRGGIPPLFVVKDAAGNSSELWLTTARDEPVSKEILDFVAEPVEISGEVSRFGNQLFFKIDPVGIKRLQ